VSALTIAVVVMHASVMAWNLALIVVTFAAAKAPNTMEVRTKKVENNFIPMTG
jgi:hypothetical protein